MDRVAHAGRVLGSDGAGIADAMVAVVRGTAPTPEIAIRADAGGRFRVALPPGEFEVEARAPDGRTGRAIVAAGTAPLELRIVVDAPPGDGE